eukprot:11164473-Lingulodinium_polyedra.AAC.1
MGGGGSRSQTTASGPPQAALGPLAGRGERRVAEVEGPAPAHGEAGEAGLQHLRPRHGRLATGVR